jgi:hypothetical protein
MNAIRVSDEGCSGQGAGCCRSSLSEADRRRDPGLLRVREMAGTRSTGAAGPVPHDPRPSPTPELSIGEAGSRHPPMRNVPVPQHRTVQVVSALATFDGGKRP